MGDVVERASSDLAGVRETLDILSVPGQADAIDEGLRDVREGRLFDGPTALAPYLDVPGELGEG